jgi:hypothetical protein
MRRTFGTLVLIVAFAAVLCSANLPIPIAEATSYPTAKVTSVDYPHLVSAGASFQVIIRAEYSDKFLADIGIWDADEGLMVQSFTLISQFTGPGNVTFNLSLFAPTTVGQWHLIAINRVWWQDAWYEDPKGGAMPFTVTVEGLSNIVTLTLGSVGTSAQIVVDNASYQIQNQSSITLALQPGPHSLQAPLVVQGTFGERYVFVGWSDGVNSDPRQVLLTQPTSLSALYRSEYYLSVQSDRGELVGEGWYGKGEQATVVVTPTVTVPSFPGVIDEYRFNGWSGDSSSTSYVLTLTMDGPKQIDATWIKTGTTIDQDVAIDLLLLGCVILGVRLVFVRYRQRDRGARSPIGGAGHKTRFICLGVCLLILSATFPMALAQLPSPKASSVRIGDAEWYYWDRPGSDTCLLWLGGGIPQEAEPGSYGYLINPFDYESFGTIRFIQDLASYYCVLALQQGSTEGFNPAANRTIYQEFFTPQTSVIEAVHKWIGEHGYQHTFVVGYSVGGEAATAELTLSHPEDWSTQDGLVLITVPFGQDVIKNANELRTNLFVIYGGNLPDYEATGLQYFNSAQPEGLRGVQYFHKEFHVLADVGHEVWTIRATGDYDTQALNLIVAFIERSKVLQIESSLGSRVSNSTGIKTARIVSVQSPKKVAEGEPFVVQCNLSLNSAIPPPTILAAYETGQGLVSETAIASNNTIAQLVIPPTSNSTDLSLSIIVLQNSTGRWVQASNTYPAKVTVNNLVTVTIVTSIPVMVLSFDNTKFTTNSSGIIQIQTVPGQHSIQVQPFIYFGNTSRLRFTGWDDSTNTTMRQLNLNDNTTLYAVYTQQYFVQVNSPYGQTAGSGWYDAGSLATVLVQPPMLNEPPVFFSHWTTGMNASEVRTLLPANSPTIVEAVWNGTSTPPELNASIQSPWLLLSVITFMILLLLNVKTRKSKKLVE